MAESRKRKKGQGHLKTKQETRKKLLKHYKNQINEMAESNKQPIMYEWAPTANISWTGQEFSIVNNFVKTFETIDFNTGQLSKHQLYAVAIMQNKLRQMIEQGIAKPVYAPVKEDLPKADVANANEPEVVEPTEVNVPAEPTAEQSNKSE